MTSWFDDLPAAPQLGDELSAPRVRPEVLSFLAERRSLTPAQMTDPGPSSDELAALLRLAARVPDHRRVHPFRFITFEGEARSRFGEVLAAAFSKAEPDASEEALAVERGRFERVPLVVAVISSVDHAHKTPEWEQILTAAAAAQNLLLAAGAAGYAAQWLTEWYAYDEAVTAAMGLAGHERVVGFVYIGTATESPKERARMTAPELTSPWTAPLPQDQGP